MFVTILRSCAKLPPIMSELYPLKLFGLYLITVAALVAGGMFFSPGHTYCSEQGEYACFKLSVGQDYNTLSKPELKEVARVVSRFYNLEPSLIIALIEVESNFNPLATSHRGAKGLMQINSITAKELGLSDPYHPIENIVAGVRYVAKLKKRFDNNLDLTLAAYNAGPTLVANLGAVPDYKETKNYIKNIRSKLKLS